MPRGPPHRHAQRGLLGAFALQRMIERPIYGGELVQQIGEATQGGWRPSAGAVYPALSHLVERGLARASRRDGRKVYAITPRGRTHLRQTRARMSHAVNRFGEMRGLVLALVEPSDRGDWVFERLRRSLELLRDAARPEGLGLPVAERRRLITRARSELADVQGILAAAARRGKGPVSTGAPPR